MKRRMSFQEQLSRICCDKKNLDRKALKVQKSLKEIQELLDKKP